MAIPYPSKKDPMTETQIKALKRIRIAQRATPSGGPVPAPTGANTRTMRLLYLRELVTRVGGKDGYSYGYLYGLAPKGEALLTELENAKS